MKRVLVTGIGGFVGSHVLAHVMKNTDWDVVGIDSFRHKGKTDRVADLLVTYPEYRERLTILTHDLLAPISPQMDRRIGAVDYVFNLASESHVDRSITDPRPFIENNVSLMLTMLEWLREHAEVKHFIQISTDEVYGPAEAGHDHPEGDPHRPSNPYSASKSAQEDICFSYWRTYGLPITITNTMNMIGQLQDIEKYLPKVIMAIQEDAEITVHVSPDGVPGSRYYLHARNLADALVFLARRTPAAYPADDIDRFNIVSQDEIDNRQMVHLAAAYLGKTPKIVDVDAHSKRPGHDRRYGLDGAKLRALGWTLPIEFKEGLETTIKWYVENPEWLT